MANEQSGPKGPDLAQGIAPEQFGDSGIVDGHVGDEPVLLARFRDDYFAMSSTCSHYGGPLGEGLRVGDSVHCPWHHARFCLRTGEAIGAPAFNSLPCWRVEKRDGKVFVREKLETPPAKKTRKADMLRRDPARIVIVGGGGAGFSAAEMLRREGYSGSLTLITADGQAPYDRPNCSKDYLAGSAPEEWMPLRPTEFYRENAIDLVLRTEVTAIDARSHHAVAADGRTFPFDRLLLATGAEPIRLTCSGADLPHVHVLRSLDDSRAIIERAQSAKHAVVIGASFIGLEAAAALRTRGIDVHIVAPESRPLERVLGREFGDFVRQLHEEHGVVFHLEETATAIDGGKVILKSGSTLAADLVVVGIGVRPRLQLAEQAGLKIDRGVVVNAQLETSIPGIYAAGDIARWPDRHAGENLRIEHWVVAERQGQAAARNMLGQELPFTDTPFFWTQHYDVPINYVGHAEKWDNLDIAGDIKGRDCLVKYKLRGRTLAAASIYRDVESLKEEASFEQQNR